MPNWVYNELCVHSKNKNKLKELNNYCKGLSEVLNQAFCSFTDIVVIDSNQGRTVYNDLTLSKSFKERTGEYVFEKKEGVNDITLSFKKGDEQVDFKYPKDVKIIIDNRSLYSFASNLSEHYSKELIEGNFRGEVYDVTDIKSKTINKNKEYYFFIGYESAWHESRLSELIEGLGFDCCYTTRGDDFYVNTDESRKFLPISIIAEGDGELEDLDGEYKNTRAFLKDINNLLSKDFKTIEEVDDYCYENDIYFNYLEG